MEQNYHCLITSEIITVGQSIPYVEDDVHGAACHFLGIVRNHNNGKSVIGVYYEVCNPLAVNILNKIAKEALAHFLKLKVYIAHYSGFLNVGEISVLVSTSSPHRDASYKANRYIIESIKHQCPIWKQEYYADSKIEWVKGFDVLPHS